MSEKLHEHHGVQKLTFNAQTMKCWIALARVDAVGATHVTKDLS